MSRPPQSQVAKWDLLIDRVAYICAENEKQLAIMVKMDEFPEECLQEVRYNLRNQYTLLNMITLTYLMVLGSEW